MLEILEERRKATQSEGVPNGLILEALVDKICRGVEPMLQAFLDAIRLGNEDPDPKHEVEFELLRLFAKRVRRSERGECLCLATVQPPIEVLDGWDRDSHLQDPRVARALFLRLLDEARYDMFWEKGWRVEGNQGFPLGQNQKRYFLGLEEKGDEGTGLGWFQWIGGHEIEEQETNLSRMVGLSLGSQKNKYERDSVLKRLWTCWLDTGILAKRNLKGGRTAYVLDWDKLRFVMPLSFRRCSRCGYVGPEDRWFGALCSTCGQEGDHDSPDLYRPDRMDSCLFSAMEHTAQWGERASRVVMQAFKRCGEGLNKTDQVRGPIHLLSSSTTYEVGVDLGDLSQVLLRNLPASSSSLVQRIGRAGRRESQAALTVTYLRPFATDRIILLDPLRHIVPRPPSIKRDVPVMIRRHVRAALLSWAIHQCPELGGLGEDEDLEGEGPPTNITLAQFYVDDGHLHRYDAPEVCREKLREWLESFRQRLPRDGYSAVLERLRDVPARLYVGILKYLAADLPPKDKSLESMVEDLRTELANHRDWFEVECRFQYGLLAEILESLSALEREQALDTLCRQIAHPYRPPKNSGLWQRMVIPEWAKAGITPGYAFPIHPVELDVRSSRGRLLDLERDATLGLGEYVPGAQVTAGGRVYMSEGIQLCGPPRQRAEGLEERWHLQLDPSWCVYCSRCGHLRILRDREALRLDLTYASGKCPGCTEVLEFPAEYRPPAKKGKKYEERILGQDINLFPVVKPRGFVTFDVGGKVFTRQRAVHAQPPQWLPQAHGSTNATPLKHWGLRYSLLETEKIAVLNLGRYNQLGFRLCPNTGLDLDLRVGKNVMEPGKPVYWFSGAKYDVPLAPVTHRVGLFTDFETDVLVLEPNGVRTWSEIEARSLMTALLVVTPEVLQAERREVGGLLYPRRPPGGAQHIQVVLYDNVHGGAGLMKELAEVLDGLDGLIARALELLSRCQCRLSCPNCLKLPWNQRDHGMLDRFAARDWVRDAQLES